MKTAMTIFGAILFASAILTSCGGGSNDKKIVQETTETKIDPLGGDTPNKTTANEITPANVTVKIFFRTRDMSGYEGYEDSKPETSERDEFRKKTNTLSVMIQKNLIVFKYQELVRN